jgi:hypothetical protein
VTIHFDAPGVCGSRWHWTVTGVFDIYPLAHCRVMVLPNRGSTFPGETVFGASVSGVPLQLWAKQLWWNCIYNRLKSFISVWWSLRNVKKHSQEDYWQGSSSPFIIKNKESSVTKLDTLPGRRAQNGGFRFEHGVSLMPEGPPLHRHTQSEFGAAWISFFSPGCQRVSSTTARSLLQ